MEEKQEKPVEGKEEVEEVTEETTEETKEETTEETEETSETEPSESEEKPKEEEEDYHTPEETKPKRTEKEKAEFALKSVASRVEELGGDPSKLIGESKEEDTSQYVTKRDFAEAEVRKLARSPKEVDAMMAWVDKGLSVEDAHLIANKHKVKTAFAEIERGNVAMKEATGAGQKKPVVNSPKPTEMQIMQWGKAKMVYDPVTKIAKGKHTEEYYDGKEWKSRRIK
ncbi:MAG TPA: hypothetical protein ENI23_07170 [bacterium]|nr:hypothetical protein [bacterium]